MNFIRKKVEELNLANWPKVAVPIIAQVNEHIPHLCGLPHDYLLRDDPVAMAECTLLVYEYYNFSLLIANLDVYNFEAEAMGQKMSYEKNRYPDINHKDYLIKNKDDLKKIKFQGLNTGRFPYLIKYLETYKKYTGLYPDLDACAPWSLACNIFGINNLALSVLNNKEFAHDLFSRIVHDFLAPMYYALKKVFPDRDTYGLADAFASPPIVSPKIFKEYVVKYFHELSQKVADIGITFATKGVWGIGELPEKTRESFASDLVSISKGVLTGMDPDIQKITPHWFREYANKINTPLTLGLSTVFLQEASIESIVQRVKEYTLVGKKGKTPFLFFINNVAPFTDSQHVHAAVQTIRTYGQVLADEKTKFKVQGRESFIEFLIQKKENNINGYTFSWLKHSSLNI